MNEAILALDCGTSGVKSTLIIRRRKGRSVVILPANKTSVPTTAAESRVVREWDPDQFIRHVTGHIFEEVVRADLEQAKIVAIAPTTTTSSLVALDSTKIQKVPRPMRWDDRQAHKEAETLEGFRKKSSAFGWIDPVSSDSGLAKALFLVRTHHKFLSNPDHRILEQWTFLNWWLTRIFVQSESILSRKWGFSSSSPWPNSFRESLNSELAPFYRSAGAAGTDPVGWLQNKMLPGTISPTAALIGPVYHRVRAGLDLPHGCRVYSVPYDACAQVLGLGILDSPNHIAVVLGTSLGITATLNSQRRIPVTPAGPIPDTPVSGRRMLFDGFASCGSAIEYVCKQHNILTDKGEPNLKFVDDAIQRTKAGANGYLMLPFFNGGRRTAPLSLIDEGGVYSGNRVSIGKDEYVKGLFEAFGYLIRTVIEDFERRFHVRFTSLLAGGGPAKSAPFMQNLADITQRSVLVNEYPDSSLIGCGICAAVGLGWFASLEAASKSFIHSNEEFRPQEQTRRTYDRLYSDYKKRFHNQLAGGI